MVRVMNFVPVKADFRGLALQMKLGIFPIFKRPGTLKAWAREVGFFMFIQGNHDVFPHDQMLAAVAETRFVEAPPLRVGVVLIEQP